MQRGSFLVLSAQTGAVHNFQSISVYAIIYNATTPILVQKGGVHCEPFFIFFPFCLGKYSCLLYLQMAGQKGLSGSQPRV